MARPPLPEERHKQRWEVGQIRGVLMLPAFLVIAMSTVMVWRATEGLTDLSVELSVPIRERTLGSIKRQVASFMVWPIQSCAQFLTDWEAGHVPLAFDELGHPHAYANITRMFYDASIAMAATAPTVSPSHFYFATQQGTMMLYSQDKAIGNMESWERTHPSETSLKIYWRDAKTNERLGLKSEIVGYDPRSRGWYRQTAFTPPGQLNWTAIYMSVDGTMAITAVTKVAQPDGEWVGVAAADTTLKVLRSFAQVARPTPRSILFIFERTGELVATSSPTPVTYLVDGERKRYTLLDAPVHHIRAAATFLEARYGHIGAVPERLNASIESESTVLFMDLSDIADPYGLRWAVCLLLPRDDVLGTVAQERQQLAIALILLALAVTVTSVAIVSYVLYPLRVFTRRIQQQEEDIAARRSAAGDRDGG